MKIHIITIGKPKLTYAKAGWAEYAQRLGKLQQLRITHISDKHAKDSRYILNEMRDAISVVLEVTGTEYSSEALANFLRLRELESREVCFVVGGPEGLPQNVRTVANHQWSLSRLTLPHDLAMVVTLEALYRASTINAQLPYHK